MPFQKNSIFVLNNQGKDVAPLVEDFSDAIVAMALPIWMVFNGDLFSDIDTVDLASAEVSERLIVTPDSDDLFYLHEFVTASENTTVELFEETQVSDNGSEVTIYNHNRREAEAATIKVYDSPTVDSDGTKLCRYELLANKSTGFIDPADRWILKPNTNYLCRITSNANSNTVTWTMTLVELKDND